MRRTEETTMGMPTDVIEWANMRIKQFTEDSESIRQLVKEGNLGPADAVARALECNEKAVAVYETFKKHKLAEIETNLRKGSK
jgi:hypothetical protein